MKTKAKFLIIDDEVDYCMLLKDYFAFKGYDVFTANTLQTGLAILRKENPAVLILDNNLPDGQGWMCAPDIVASHPLMKIYLISAYKTVRDQPMHHPNLVIWEKPLSIDVLEAEFLK